MNNKATVTVTVVCQTQMQKPSLELNKRGDDREKTQSAPTGGKNKQLYKLWVSSR